jgi:caffeoyl-CoA O-methyltransferase
VAVALLRPGGLFITDNALWSGKVADEAAKDATTEAVRAFNRSVFSRPDLETVLLPVHDGLAVCRKR